MPTYRFGDFELDLDALQLRRLGEPVRLERRPMDLLVLLVRHHGRMVSREEIIAALWPARVIIDFDAGLNTLIRKVRDALGDSRHNPAFIETVPGRGYRFVAEVREVVGADSMPTDSSAAQSAVPMPRSRRAAAVAIAVLALFAIVLTWQSGVFRGEPMRIAVLPFENLTGTDELSYMASGLAEETRASLAQIDLPDLAVIGGVSAAALADSPLPILQLGRELDVDFVVESSLRLEESRIRVTSRLLRVADSAQVWTASFDRELTNVLGLQRELSIAIAEQVRQRLSPAVSAAIDRRQTQNPAAYELFLKGRYAWSRFLPDSTSQALRFYARAVTVDPGYALAWAGITHALSTSPMTADVEPETILGELRDAAQRALAAGPELAEVQHALGSLYFFQDWDWARAETAARRAVDIDPNSALSHMLLGIVLSQIDRHVEARTMLRRARELDPLFPLMFANSAVVALQAGDREDAIEFARQAIAINPEFWVGYYHLGNARLVAGDYDAALDAYSEAVKLSGGNSKAVASRAFVLARTGRTEAARADLAELISRSASQYVPPYNVASIYAGLGETDRAFAWLDRALAVRDVHLVGLQKYYMFDSLRSDPRYHDLLRRCGFVSDTSS